MDRSEVNKQKQKKKKKKKSDLMENNYRVQKHFPFGGRFYSPRVREVSACESDTATLPPASKWGAQGGRRVGGAGCGAQGSQTGGSRLLSRADSSRGWSSKYCTESPRRKGSCRGARKAAPSCSWHLPGSAGAVCSPRLQQEWESHLL